MTGLKIALTGAVLFIVFVMFRAAAKNPPEDKIAASGFGLMAFVALLSIPYGLIYQIWSN